MLVEFREGCLLFSGIDFRETGGFQSQNSYFPQCLEIRVLVPILNIWVKTCQIAMLQTLAFWF